jgi:hypothetical protein
VVSELSPGNCGVVDISEFWAKWPGDESIDELLSLLEERRAAGRISTLSGQNQN